MLANKFDQLVNEIKMHKRRSLGEIVDLINHDDCGGQSITITNNPDATVTLAFFLDGVPSVLYLTRLAEFITKMYAVESAKQY